MKINLLHNKKNIHYNIENWTIEDYPMLLITGLSGSGKTTLAKEIALSNSIPVISFDVLKFYDDAPKKSQEIMNYFINEHRYIYNLVVNHWSKTDHIFSNDILYNYFCNVFFDFLINYCKKNNTRIVLEGIQIFTRMHPYKTIGMPLIIIGSSSLKSNINKFKRDYIIKKEHFNLIRYISYTYLYHIKQRFSLNHYIYYYELLDSFLKKQTTKKET